MYCESNFNGIYTFKKNVKTVNLLFNSLPVNVFCQYFYKQFGPRLFDTLMLFLENIYIFLNEKKNHHMTKIY